MPYPLYMCGCGLERIQCHSTTRLIDGSRPPLWKWFFSSHSLHSLHHSATPPSFQAGLWLAYITQNMCLQANKINHCLPLCFKEMHYWRLFVCKKREERAISWADTFIFAQTSLGVRCLLYIYIDILLYIVYHISSQFNRMQCHQECQTIVCEGPLALWPLCAAITLRPCRFFCNWEGVGVVGGGVWLAAPHYKYLRCA